MCSKPQRTELLKLVRGKTKDLFLHTFANEIIEELYNNYANETERILMQCDIYSKYFYLKIMDQLNALDASKSAETKPDLSQMKSLQVRVTFQKKNEDEKSMNGEGRAAVMLDSGHSLNCTLNWSVPYIASKIEVVELTFLVSLKRNRLSFFTYVRKTLIRFILWPSFHSSVHWSVKKVLLLHWVIEHSCSWPFKNEWT